MSKHVKANWIQMPPLQIKAANETASSGNKSGRWKQKQDDAYKIIRTQVNEIESLRVENERLREMLERALEKLPCPHPLTKGLITAKACMDRGDCGCETEASLVAAKIGSKK